MCRLQQTKGLITLRRVTLIGLLTIGLSACNGTSSEENTSNTTSYTVTPQAGDNGAISPDRAQSVTEGETIGFTLTPDSSYSIADVRGCDGTLSGNTYTTGSINANCTVTASFELNNYTVIPQAGDNGSISPNEAQTVKAGETTSFTLTPDSSYSIADVTGCDGTLSGNTYTTGAINSDCSVTVSYELNSYTVTPQLGKNGSISPNTAQSVNHGDIISFILTPNRLYSIGEVSGCNGTISRNTFTTGAIIEDCTVTANFQLNSYKVTPQAGDNGSISPSDAQTVNAGKTTSFTVTPDSSYSIAEVTGCDGTISGNTFTTGAITEDCTITASFELLTPGLPLLSLETTAIKTFRFTWEDVSGETQYRLLENADGLSGYIQVANIAANTTTYHHEVFLPARINASYILQACNEAGCSDSPAVFVDSNLAEAVGYFKASNTGEFDSFGYHVAISGDGNTLAVGAYLEDSNAVGVNGNQGNDAATNNSGAVYVFNRNEGIWSQQAYIKSSNTGEGDHFGWRIALSYDGNSMAVGAKGEGSNATGINGNQSNNDATSSGAVYVFIRSGSTWLQHAYVKASNSDDFDNFGYSVALSANGDTLAVGAWMEDSNAVGINGNQDNAGSSSGAVYVFYRSGTSWSQQAYVKASNTDNNDRFGSSVALSSDGNTLAVGAKWEDSNATGINGNQSNNSEIASGAVYVFTRSVATWSQQAYIKASNTEGGSGLEQGGDRFGSAVALSGDGDTLAVGAYFEGSNATGIDGDQSNNLAYRSGAVYVFTRSFANWSQQAYIKASNPDEMDLFGREIALSGDGNTLVVGAYHEDSDASGINGDQSDDTATNAGAVYVFTRIGDLWSQQAYVKASNTREQASFGSSVALSSDGKTLAVGSYRESSNATGIGGDQSDDALSSGAVYLY